MGSCLSPACLSSYPACLASSSIQALLILVVVVWVLVFLPLAFPLILLVLLLPLFKLFFSHFTSSVFQRKAMHICLVLSHLINTLLGLLRQSLIVKVLKHWLAWSIDYILGLFELLFEVFRSFCILSHCLL